MAKFVTKISTRVSPRLFVSLLCVVLVVFAGMLAASHGHDAGGPAHSDCGLCATAHVSVQLAAAVTLLPVAQVFSRVTQILPPLRPRTLSRFALFTRPPPARTLAIS